eukprot:3582983-Alexandrium_andersonii.AAC.1
MPPPAVPAARVVPVVPSVPPGTVVNEDGRDAIARQAQAAMAHAANAEPTPVEYLGQASGLTG